MKAKTSKIRKRAVKAPRPKLYEHYDESSGTRHLSPERPLPPMIPPQRSFTLPVGPSPEDRAAAMLDDWIAGGAAPRISFSALQDLATRIAKALVPAAALRHRIDVKLAGSGPACVVFEENEPGTGTVYIYRHHSVEV